jgi:hypothetical protein
MGPCVRRDDIELPLRAQFRPVEFLLELMKRFVPTGHDVFASRLPTQRAIGRGGSFIRTIRNWMEMNPVI